MTFQLLRADLARQFEFEGKSKTITVLDMFLRLPTPRYLPLVLFRCSRGALLSGVPVVPYILSYLNLLCFGLQVSPRCDIGPGLFLPHPVGTVIGAWKMGSNVTVFQNVTLGAKDIDMKFTESLLPTIGDHVTLGAGAKVLGGIHIGDHVVVGANSVVIRSVSPGRTIAGVPAREIRSSRWMKVAEDADVQLRESATDDARHA